MFDRLKCEGERKEGAEFRIRQIGNIEKGRVKTKVYQQTGQEH